MLLTKTVTMKWNGNNKKWYEDKGYIYTKLYDEFEVKVEDLPQYSRILVDIRCDNCNEIIKRQWQCYLQNKHKDNMYYCKKCGYELFAKEKISKTILNKSISFEQWCIKNNHQEDVLDRWDYELNNCNPNEICYNSNKKYWFKCPKGMHNSELKIVNSFTNGRNGAMDCNQCNSFAQWGINKYGEDFLEKYWSNKNTINPWEISYGSESKKIWIKCQNKNYHEDYNVLCKSFIADSRCPYCRGLKVHPLDSLGNLLENENLLWIWSNKNKKSPYEYSPKSSQKVWWKCENGHNDYKRSIKNSNDYNFHCPECVRERDESFLQEKIRLYLESLEHTILHENKCTIIPINPKTKHHLPFDNEIKELRLIVEVHGQQHYDNKSKWIDVWARKKGMTREKYFHYQKLKDRYKKFITYKQKYNYLEIPYWTDDKQETWKQLIDDKINEILSICSKTA